MRNNVFALIVSLVIATAIYGGPPTLAWFRAQVAEVQHVQANRRAWRDSCHTQGGQIVYNGKGSPSNLCFGPDGRLIGSY